MEEDELAQMRADDNGMLITSSTGGQKGEKPEQYDDIYWPALRSLARVYAMGAAKYSRGNYRKGYPASLSISAAMRHFAAWMEGEDLDPESGESHLSHVVWHCFNLQQILDNHREEFDDRI